MQMTFVLPSPHTFDGMSFAQVLNQRRSKRSFCEQSLSLSEISQLCYSAQGISSNNKRVCPSAGALYPLELYIVVQNVDDLQPGLYKYNPGPHELNLLIIGNLTHPIYNAALRQESVMSAPVNFVFSAVYDRICSKYGHRGERYAHIEVGHAAQNLCLRATSLSLHTVCIGAFDGERLSKSMNLPVTEAPLYIVPVGK
ncbi:hypothetical protein P9112_005659 [Eukaryota sp. TZLM1-RC]